MKNKFTWLLLPLILLILPEIIFSPILNTVISLLKPSNHLWRDNILFSSSIVYLNIIFIIQFVGSVFANIFFFKNKLQNRSFIILGIFLSIISLLILLLFIFVNIFSRINF